ncbi:hypothetical protein VTN96DRAFT_9614 [Rasamsonia emersonii]
MPIDRAAVRNGSIYDGATGASWGGVRQNGAVTEAVFLSILSEILLVAPAPVTVTVRASGRTVLPTNNPLEPGAYDVYCNGSIELTNEPWVHRIMSHSISGREDSFSAQVRARDGKCVLSGLPNLNALFGDWSGFESAHIFPLEKENIWSEDNFGRWITNMDNTNGVPKINSCQNGLLLRRDLHQSFDNYLISVNPDDDYKIIVFSLDTFGLDGRSLDPVCRNPADPNHVSDELLRWHFRQSVLANMRGAGEPIFEHDFPTGTDIMTEIREGPYAKERFEMELSSRLRAFDV